MENLWAKIGETAGRIYHLLEEGEKSLYQIEKTLKKEGYNSNIIKMAIGWLAREDKVEVLKDKNKWVIKLK
ncbi:winged helix-turn-helix domain-containing protein [Methanocaldococcus sp.]